MARVIGTVVATRKAADMDGLKLLVVEPIDRNHEPAGEIHVAIDTAQAGEGDVVTCVGSREGGVGHACRRQDQLRSRGRGDHRHRRRRRLGGVMLVCRVVGNVVMTVKHPAFQGEKLLCCQPLDDKGNENGAVILAIDRAQAGPGDKVLVMREGSGVRQIRGPRHGQARRRSREDGLAGALDDRRHHRRRHARRLDQVHTQERRDREVSPSLQRDVAEIARALHAAGWVANHDGNVSVRMPDKKRFVATPTATSKRLIDAHGTITVDIEGKVLGTAEAVRRVAPARGSFYKARPYVNAVIHAHPAHATAFGAARKPLGAPPLPEMVVSLGGSVPLIEYAMPGRTARARRPRCGCSRRCSGPRPAGRDRRLSVTRNPDEVRRVLGFMPDAFGVYDDMKVWEYLDFFARCYGLPAAGRRRMIGDLLELVDLGTSATPTSRPSRAGCSSGCAWPTRSSTIRRCCSWTSPPRASTLAPGSSCASCSASCARWARPSSSAATSCPSSRSCARASRSSTGARSWPRARVATSRQRLRFGAVLRVRLLLDEAQEAARDWFAADPDVASAVILPDGTIELGFRGDDAASARLLAASVASGLSIVSFARAASDLEELFLQVTSADREPVEAA